jgi:hypothetical protein
VTPNWHSPRRRPAGPPRLSPAEISALLAAAAPAELPLIGVTAMWEQDLADAGASIAHCVDGCCTVQYALARYGIAAHVEAVAVRVGGSRIVRGERPRYNPDGTFNGHTILVVAGAGRLADPTVQQFPEVPRTRAAALPMVAPLPVPGGLGDGPVVIGRGDHYVVYQPLPAALRQAWRSAATDARDAGYQRAGAELADQVIAMLRADDLRQRARLSPYPRLRALLAGGR